MGTSVSVKHTLRLFAVRKGTQLCPKCSVQHCSAECILLMPSRTSQHISNMMFTLCSNTFMNVSFQAIHFSEHTIFYCWQRAYHPPQSSKFIPQYLWPFFFESYLCFCQIPGFWPRVQLKINKHPICFEFLCHSDAPAMLSMAPVKN